MATALDFDSGGIQRNKSHSKDAGHNIRPMTTRKELASSTPTVNDENSIYIYYEQGCLKVLGNVETASHVQVTDLSDRIMFQGAVNNGSCTLPNMSSGVYIATLSDGFTCVKTQKVIIR